MTLDLSLTERLRRADLALDLERMAEMRAERERKPVEKTQGISRKVVCVNTGVEYPSIAAAAKASSALPNTIRYACVNGYQAGGTRWRFAEDKNYVAAKPKKRPVLCETDGTRFDSIVAVVGNSSTERKRLMRAIARGIPYRGKVYGYVESREAAA